MKSVRLYPQDDGGIDLPAVDGGTIHLPEMRLRAWTHWAGEPVLRQAVIDTGAPACILSPELWKPFHQRGMIEWICHAPDHSDVEALPTIDLLNGRHPYRLGRISLQIEDLDGKSLDSQRVRVICVEDAPGTEPLPRLLLLGLNDVLNNQTLSLSASADGALWTASLTTAT